jgi:2-polyprenyl-6-methoxyphenol hydroxylase-like FAD-dependent oxidoreductase
MAAEKNYDLLLRAFGEMKRANSRCRFVLVGDGPLRERLQRENPAYVFTGFIARGELAQHYASADIYIHASLTETFGNVLTEAMASGLAVAGFDYAAAQQFVRHGENGLVVPCDQPDALVEQPRAFPVQLLLARRLLRGRAILLGASGHRCHPVGGQGLNLCWRDVAVLHRLALRAASGQLSVQRLPAAYGRSRWPDLLLTLAATDLLVRLFSNRQPLLLPLRHLALLSLARFAPLRRLSLALMGDGFS